MKTENPDFILFGEGNYNTLGVLHELHEVGIIPLLLLVGKAKDRKRGNIIGYSKYAKRIVEVASQDEGLNWIITHQDSFSTGTVIYPTSDNGEMLLDSHFNSLHPKFRFPNAGKQGEVAKLMDKQFQTHLAKASGLRILESQYTTSTDFSFQKVKYPCMAKPLNSTRGSKGDMRICSNESELKIALRSGKQTQDYIVQQYIHNEADLLFLGIAYKNGDIWLPAVVIKPGVSPIGEYSHAIISTNVERYLPEIDNVRSLLQQTNYSGPFSIEFGHENGNNYFFEINFRNDGTSHYPLGAGVNIASAYINDIIPTNVNHIEYEMIDETGDLRRVLTKELSFSQWYKKFRDAGSYRFYYKGDTNLIFPLTYMFISRTIGKIFRSLHS